MDRQLLLLLEIAKHPNERIFSFVYGGKKIWVKRAEKVRHAFWLRLARAISLELSLGILQPGANPDGRKAIRFERGRLERLKRRGIYVPTIFAVGDDWSALIDCGDNVADLVRNCDLSFTLKKNILTSAAENLAKLHGLRLHHGRPALKDMAWNGQETALLDFEDGIIIGITCDKCIMRDVLIFVQSIFKEAGNDARELAEDTFARYKQLQPDYAARAQAYFGSFTVLYLCLRLFLRYMGKDLESVYQTLLFFREYDRE